MPDFQKLSDPSRNAQFSRCWNSPLPPSPAEARLSELRAALGNIEGTRIFREERRRQKGAWL